MIFTVLVALEAAAVVLAVRVTCLDTKTRTNYSKSLHDRDSVGLLRTIRADIGRVIRSPLCVVLAFALADELLVEAIHVALAGAPKPWRGWHRAAYHLETCLVLGWPALLAGAAWSAFGRNWSPARAFTATVRHDSGHSTDAGNAALPPYARRSDPTTSYRGTPTVAMPRRVVELLFGAWLTAVGGMAACYPLPHGWTAPVLHACELALVAVALAAIPAGWRSRAIVTREGRALLLVIVTELVVAILGAWGTGAGVFSSWDVMARVPYAIGWGAVIVALARGSSRSAARPTA